MKAEMLVRVEMAGLPEYVSDAIENAVADILEPMDFACDTSDDGAERILEFTPPQV